MDALDKDPSDAVRSVCGALWLIAAVAAARRLDAGVAAERLDRAERLATAVGDANHRWTAFGPTNVAIHRVTVAVGLGDAPRALAQAARLDPNRLPDTLQSRRAQIGLDVAWAHTRRRRDADALIALLEVERAAPGVTRHNVHARPPFTPLLTRARGTSANAVRGLAARSGVTV